MKFNVPTLGNDVALWANDMRRWLVRSWDALTFKDSTATAKEDGILLWDASGAYPVVSKGGVWRQVVLADGLAILGQDADITAAAPSTAYAITLDGITLEGITLTGTPLTDITFTESGLYSIAFTAQISSTSSSTVEFRFWPRINGSDVTGSTIVASLHNNGATTVVSRSAMFQVTAGTVLKVMWATDSVSGFLEAHAATAYAPASPSVTVSISRVRQ